jgi:nicotinamide mononucleotide transporter
MKTAAVVLFALVSVGLVAARLAEAIPSSWLEIGAVISGAGCVLLVVRRNVWNFPLGIASSLGYLLLFSNEKLYADAGLQIVFVLLGVHGWVAWVRGRVAETPIARVPLGELTALAVIFPVFWFGLAQILEAAGGAAPTLDAFVATLSVCALWLLNRRYVETWLGWIVVDQVAVYLFWTRGLHLTAGLYAVFLLMCVAGLIEWRRHLPAEESR